MSSAEHETLFLILLMGVLAPLAADWVPRRVRPPVVVLEILLGILVGPHVLDWVEPGPTIEKLGRLGLAFLFFLAGFEIDFRSLRGRPLTQALACWSGSLLLGLAVSLVLQQGGVIESSTIVAVALTTTALGTLMPILRDTGELRTPFGTYVVAFGAVGEFAPLVFSSVVLTSGVDGSERALLALLLYTSITLGAAALASRVRPPYVVQLMRRMMHSSTQLPVRVSVVLLIALVFLTHELGLDAILGAVAAGLVVSLACRGEFREVLQHKLEGIGFGVFIPIFFVLSGMHFDLQALLASAAVAARLPLFLACLLLVRGAPVLLCRRDLARGDRVALGLLSATALPLVVVITQIGVATGQMRPENAAALVGAGMLSVLLFPLIALALRRRSHDAKAADSRVPCT